MRIKFSLKTFVISSLFLILFSPAYPHLLGRFAARDSYYSHGYLIPFVVLYLVWRKRDKLKAIKPEPAFAGILILLFGIILHLLGGIFLKINFASYLAIPIVLLGMVLYFGGIKMAKELIFPIVFLIFMLPLPQVIIIGISFKLKILAAQIATFTVKIMGMPVNRSGSTIYYPGGFLLVGDPCSGLRSLISFLALGAIFTQFVRAKPWRKTILFASSVPIAFLSNAARLIFLLWVSYIYGEKIALGFLHDFSGIMVFIIGFLGLIMISKILKCRLDGNIT